MTHQPLSEEVRRFLEDTVPTFGFPRWAELDDATGAAYLQAARRPTPEVPVEGVEAVDLLADGRIPVRLYRRVEGPTDTPVIVYMHGGGWATGDTSSNDLWCRQLVDLSGMPLVSIDYRLAPEHPFPAPLEDCVAATAWVANNAELVGGDVSRLVVLGSSAGGNLAAAVAIRAHRDGGPLIRCQALLYPVLDSRCSSASYSLFANGYFLERDQMDWYWRQYVPRAEERTDPLASPMHATDLSGLPPAVVMTAGLDPLRDEAEAYAHRLQKAGVPVVSQRYTGQLHGFIVNPTAFSQSEVATSDLVRHLLHFTNDADAAGPVGEDQ